jgi:hypothetical protein
MKSILSLLILISSIISASEIRYDYDLIKEYTQLQVDWETLPFFPKELQGHRECIPEKMLPPEIIKEVKDFNKRSREYYQLTAKGNPDLEKMNKAQLEFAIRNRSVILKNFDIAVKKYKISDPPLSVYISTKKVQLERFFKNYPLDTVEHQQKYTNRTIPDQFLLYPVNVNDPHN